MFKEKSYTGVKTGYANTNEILSFYGTNISTNTFLTNLFCETLETFLKNECGISDCEYNSVSKTMNIKGIPVFYRCYPYNTSGVNRCYVDMYFPFSGVYGQLTGNTTTYRQSFLYDSTTGAYTITLRILGEPTAFFYLIIKSYISTVKTSSSTTSSLTNNLFPSYYLSWSKGKDLVRKKNFIAISYNFSGSYRIYEFEDDGSIIDMTISKNVFNPNKGFNAFTGEKEEFTQTLPLIPWEYNGWYEWEGIYKYINNIGLPNSSNNINSDSQLFVTINGETYLFLYSTIYGIVKIIN